MIETLSCYIKVLTPLHIGCGEEYQPVEYRLDSDIPCLIAGRPIDVVSSLSADDRKAFLSACSKGGLQGLREIYRLIQKQTFSGRPIAVSKGFADHFAQTILADAASDRDFQKGLEQFAIQRTSFISADCRPYIPGTALKGALRTAYLNHLVSTGHRSGEEMGQRGEQKANELEKSLLGGSFATDPFRLIKVSDFLPVGSAASRVFYAVNKKKKISERPARGPHQILEAIEPHGVFRGTISIQKACKQAEIKMQPNEDTLCSAIENFFSAEKTREDAELCRAGLRPGDISELDGGLLCRLGRHSGAESLTIKGYRSIKVMVNAPGEKRAPKFLPRATTFWLAADDLDAPNAELVPFGWVELGFVDAEREAEFEEQEQQWRQEEKGRKDKEREAIRAREEARAQELRRVQEAQEAKKTREEEEERKRLEREAMPQWQKDLLRLEDEDLQETEAVAIYSKLDTYPTEERRQLAEGLRAYYIRIGKWERAKCSHKQRSKVERIKQILGG